MPPAPHLTCSAVRPATATVFAPAWRTETAVLLARGIVADDATDRLPILADVLEEAGCDDPLLLRHCRECEEHRPHCWVLTDVLERLAVAADAPRLTDDEVIREVERVTGRPVAVPDDDPWAVLLSMRFIFGRALPVVLVTGAFGLVWYGVVTGSRTQSRQPAPHTHTFPTTAAR